LTLALGEPKIANKPMERTMKDSEIIDLLGGTSALAELLDITPPSVSEWRIQGIPKARKQTLALLFPGKVPASWRPKKAKKAA